MTLGPSYIVVSAVAVLGAAFFWWALTRRLHESGYSQAWSLALSALALAAPLLTIPENRATVLLFAFSTYAVAAAAMDFANRQDARRIIVFGGSLACAELTNPLGVLLTGLALPFLLPKEIARAQRSRIAGLLVLLLFLPVLTGTLLLYLALVAHASPAQLLDGASAPRSIASSASTLIACLPCVPGIICSLKWGRRPIAPVMVFAAALATGAWLVPYLGFVTSLSGFMLAAGPLNVLLIANWREAQSRSLVAMVILLAGATVDAVLYLQPAFAIG